MLGLLIKDFKLMWMQKSFFIIIIIVGCLLTMGYNDFTFMVGFITFILSLFTVSSISYDEFDNGYPFLLTLPFSRKTYVIEKYVFGLILGLTGWLVSVLISCIMIIMNGEKITLDIMIEGLVILPMFLYIQSLMIPIHLRFGGEKGRYALIASFGIIFVIGFGIIKVIELLQVNMVPMISSILSMGPAALILILLVVGLLILLISLKISLSIMNKKEF